MAIDSDMRVIYIGKIKELAYQLKSYIVCVSMSADDTIPMREHEEFWQAKNSVDEAVELAIKGILKNDW